MKKQKIDFKKFKKNTLIQYCELYLYRINLLQKDIDYLYDICLNLLGKKGICFNCSSINGTWCLDPYEFEINDTNKIVCLCDDCFKERYFDI